MSVSGSSDLTVIGTVRHGETESNREKRYAGILDVPLSEAGAADTRKAAAKLRGERFDVVLSSELSRCTETARLLLGEHVDFVTEPLCNERNYGDLQGRLFEEARLFSITYLNVGGIAHSLDPPGGETFPELRERAERLLSKILDLHRGRRVLVFSHEVFLQQFHGAMQGIPWDEALAIKIANLDLNIFSLEGRVLQGQSVVRLSGLDYVHW